MFGVRSGDAAAALLSVALCASLFATAFTQGGDALCGLCQDAVLDAEAAVNNDTSLLALLERACSVIPSAALRTDCDEAARAFARQLAGIDDESVVVKCVRAAEGGIRP